MFKKYMPYIVSILISLGIGGLSAFLTKDSMPIYSAINRPALSPPPELFPIVWTVLFVLMGIAAGIIWCSNGRQIDSALLFYGAQLVFNFCWTLIFFNFRAYLAAFIWLCLLLVLIGITMIKFFRIKKTAGWLLLPYFAWVCFAGYLNFMVWQLNP
ncbi:MAG: tryptophan-rich sensory protein [Oscillospiraceae bacterium]|nr:tryptophan-rich sensory protein [Oscillospiraceae bacterium]